jgi:hypothetical protein
MLENEEVYSAHLSAWAVLFSTELFFSVSILFICYKNNKFLKKAENGGPSFFGLLLRSNLFVLFGHDLFGCILAASAYFIGSNIYLKNLADTMNIVKSSFPLLLATDALCMKAQQQPLKNTELMT